MKLENLVIHTTDTPYGRIVTPDDLTLWHIFPTKKNETDYTYKGKTYFSVDKLPDDVYLINNIKMSIRKYPNSGRGWSQVGYSDMINQYGELINLVPYTFDNVVDSKEITNGAAGYNSKSRHVVLAGGHSKDGKKKSGIMPITDVYSDKQIKTLVEYILAQKEIVPSLKVIGHNQLTTAKTCPNFDVQKFLIDYNLV